MATRLHATVGELARPVAVVAADMVCDQLEELFHSELDGSCVVVADGQRRGLIMRDGFEHLMSGPYGYGRALWGRSRVADVADWAPLRIDAACTVVAAVQQMRDRPITRRYDDIVVELPGGDIGRVSAAHLLEGLAGQLTHRAFHDELTGVVNRSHFLDLLTETCRDTERDRVLLAVIDLDGMKRINDSFGHLAGDAVLTRAARHLVDAARPGEIVARLGADEFVILSRTPRHLSALEAATELGNRCRLAVTTSDGSGGAPGSRIRASVGVSASGGHADPSTLLSEADMALFRAKQAGGDQVETTINVEADLAGDLEQVDRSVLDAIRDGELQVWYQPIVRCSDQSMTGVEALVRWADPRIGLLTPGRFLPGAHRAGHLPAMDRWVLTRACTDFVAMHQRFGARAPATVSVNVSPETLSTDIDEVVAEALHDAGLPAARMVLELPEDADLETLTAASPRLERLRTMGVGLVLDDMGAGSTSLRHLSTLTIGGLKIDAAFIAGMLHNPRDHTVVKLLADLGRGLNLPVTAEGIETADQLHALSELDIEYAQGFHLGRPQPVDQLNALLDGEGAQLARSGGDTGGW